MENLIFSLNATVPVFLLMVLGLFLRKIGWIDDDFADKMNKFVFRVPLPLVLFSDLSAVDFKEAWDTRFVLFCFFVTIISIGISAGISRFLKDQTLRGEFIQSSYRSSAALLGIAFIQNIYGTAGMAPLMIIGSVPLYNVMAVLVLSFPGDGTRGYDRTALNFKGNPNQSDYSGNRGRASLVSAQAAGSLYHGKGSRKCCRDSNAVRAYGHGCVLRPQKSLCKNRAIVYSRIY